MSEDNNYESRLLYTQETFVDESVKVKSNVNAISYSFTSAITPITARCRLTVVYSDLPDNTIDVKGGTIEKWSDKGWQTIDEYFDAFISFESPEEALDYLAAMIKSFLLGVPINLIPVTKEPSSPPKNPEKAPNIRVISFAQEKVKSEKTNINKSKKSDDPDFDWI